jgi:DHA2 family metal-tetracycline-proton antiporter-like MFS transporter
MDRKKLIPWIIYLLFFAVLNETVFNVSTPRIAEQFSLTPAGVSWMMTIFMILFGIGTVIFGKLSDLYPLKRLILWGILLYNAGSVMGFFLQSSYPLVILARAVQGIGASAIPALIFTAAARYFPVEERGRVFGSLTATVSLAIGLGPVVGGFVSESLHWADLFLIPLLILISIPFFNRILPEETGRKGGIDLPGAGLMALAVGTLVLELNFGQWYYLVSFLLFLTLFLVRIHTARDPFIPPILFNNRRFLAGAGVGLLLFSVVMGVLFLVPLMLHDLHGLGTRAIGLVIFPGAISSAFFGPWGGNLADRRGNPFVVVLGLGLLVGGVILMAWALGLSYVAVSACLLLVYVGFSLFQTALINSVSQTLSQEDTGIGMGVFNMIGIISGALGTAVVGKLLAGTWLARPFLPFQSAQGVIYSNLLMAFSLAGILGGAIYLRYYRGIQAAPAQEDQGR